ncbi:MAG: helix-turn-helix transcriptional regulator [Lachnospiraceae bacterium]|nr:helix-turn-helix transcriptional regulator [Lachnospiraceae bacterium]
MAMGKTLGELIKEARSGAKLTQEKLAEQIDGMTAADISKAERDQMIPSQNQLKQIAKITGITQKSLLNAAKEAADGPSSSGNNNASGKGDASGKNNASGKENASGKGSSSGKGNTSGKGNASGSGNLQLTATEKKLIELYRAADAKKKKDVISLLKGETQTTSEMLSSLLDGSKKPDEIITSLFSDKTSGSSSNAGKTDDMVSSVLGALLSIKK